jgi:ubiquinone/menaquinone biosynthesis C-methylase UbiE
VEKQPFLPLMQLYKRQTLRYTRYHLWREHTMAQHMHDHWAQWVLERGHGGDPEQQQRVWDDLYPVRNRVLQNARLTQGDIVLDVGTGAGLIAFEALRHVGPHGRVIFSDISQDLLDHCETLARERDVLDRCQFLRTSADDLTALPASSVDVVTTRSVLIYVVDKQQAFNECYRVLKAGGRLSIFEPINRYFDPRPNEFWGFEATPILDLVEKVYAAYGQLQVAPNTPLVNFTERDLVTFAEDAGFPEIHLEAQVNVEPGAWHRSWQAFVRTAPNPWTPTLEEAIAVALTADEAERFTAHLRPLVETEHGVKRYTWAYLWAVKR